METGLRKELRDKKCLQQGQIRWNRAKRVKIRKKQAGEPVPLECTLTEAEGV